MSLSTPAGRPNLGATAWPGTVAALALVVAIGALPGLGRAASAEPAAVTVHVVSHGWHSGLVVPAALAEAHDWPARREFPQADHFEVGWGDRAYYQAADPSGWMGLRALLWPSPGVLHVVALQGSPQINFPGAPMTAVRLSHDGARRLGAAIAASHERDADGQPVAFGPALYGQGRFYGSVERFHLFATCNVWVARRLREAGVELWPALALTAGMLQEQLRPAPRPGAAAPPLRAASAGSAATAAN